jgi:hypothetical protein
VAESKWINPLEQRSVVSCEEWHATRMKTLNWNVSPEETLPREEVQGARKDWIMCEVFMKANLMKIQVMAKNKSTHNCEDKKG